MYFQVYPSPSIFLLAVIERQKSGLGLSICYNGYSSYINNYKYKIKRKEKK